MKKYFDFSHFKADILGGVTAGIVALPLALAFGEQSGLGAAAGLYGAAFIAFFAALFGGTSTQISGPTAPMTASSMLIIAGLLQAYEGDFEKALPMILMVFFLAGVIQILLGVARLGTYVKYIPYTVVSGFMSGIGVIILITQLLPALGFYVAEDEEIVLDFLPHAEELILDRILMEEAQEGYLVLDDFEETVKRSHEITDEAKMREARTLAENDSKGVIGSLKYLGRAIENISLTELLLTLITILVIYGFKRITSAIPSTLIALFLVAGGAYLLGIDYVLIREIPTGIPIPHFEIFTDLDIGAITPYLVSALLLALLGAIDSLLTSVVADNLTKTQHKPNKELVGQGIGNSIAALFSGLPGAGATIRTVVNIQAGGRTRLSGMIAGVLLFVIMIVLGPIASKIPAAVLAGILITVGIGVMDYKGLKALPRMTNSEKLILLTVLSLTVFWDLVYAVGMGLVLAMFVFLKRMADISADQVMMRNLEIEHKEEPLWQDELSIDPEIRKRVIFKHLDGPMFFGFANHFRTIVSDLGHDLHILVIRLEKVPFIDQSGIYALEEAIIGLQKQNVIVALSGANAESRKIMIKMHIVPQLISNAHIFEEFEDCKKWLRQVLVTQESLDAELAKISNGD